MFDTNCLSHKPRIDNILDIPSLAFLEPPEEDISPSSLLMYMIDADEIDMIYGMRCLPFHNYTAFKIKYKYADSPESVIINNPDLCLLKAIWDIGNPGFNTGISFYCKYSRGATIQFSNESSYIQNIGTHNWFLSIITSSDKKSNNV